MRSRLHYILHTFVMAIVIVTMAACDMSSRSKTHEQEMRSVTTVRDSARYGICLEVVGQDVLSLLPDDGDTLKLFLTSDTRVSGPLTEGDRMAVQLKSGSSDEIVCIVNLSVLIGDWVEPDPVAEGNVKGYQLSDGGTAQSINLTEIYLESWSISKGDLLLMGSYGMNAGDGFTDRFTIVRLTTDSLVLKNADAEHILHRMRPGEADYADETFDSVSDPAEDFDYNPLMDAEDVKVSPDVLGDGPVY